MVAAGVMGLPRGCKRRCHGGELARRYWPTGIPGIASLTHVRLCTSGNMKLHLDELGEYLVTNICLLLVPLLFVLVMILLWYLPFDNVQHELQR